MVRHLPIPLAHQPFYKGLFYPERRATDLIVRGCISLLADSVKGSADQVNIKEDPVEVGEPHVLNEEEASGIHEEWMALESKGTKKHWLILSKWPNGKPLELRKKSTT